LRALLGSIRQYPAERYANTPAKSVGNRWDLFTERSGVLHRALMKDLTTHKEAAAMQSHPDPYERLIMVPFDARESISLAVAARLSGKAGNTIRLWAERHGIGRKIGGDWHVSRVALRMFLDGDMVALAAYHAGKRADPTVRSYFERVGCGALLQNSQTSQISQNRSGEQRQPVAIIGPRYSMTADGPRYTMTAENPDGLD
jgi:hypothetical protein